MVKFATNASGAIWWPNLQLLQVMPSGGQMMAKKWCHVVAKISPSQRVNCWVRCVSVSQYFYRTQVSLGSDLWVRLSQTEWATLADLTDVTLAGEDINSIPTDNADRAFQGNVAMQVTQPGGQLWNQTMQVTSPDDQIFNQFGTNQNAYSN